MINLRNVWEMGEDSAAMAACPFHPHFLFRLAEKKTGRGRSKRKGRFFAALRCSGPPRDGGLPSRCRQRLSAFCQLAPDRSVESALRRVSGAAENRSDQRMAPASVPAAAPWSREGQAAPSEAEGAEIEERQMLFCTPGLCRHPAAGASRQLSSGPAAPVGRPSPTRRYHLTSSPRMISDLWALAPKVAPDIFSFDRVRPFSF